MNRSSAILRIMEIERKQRRISQDKTYLRLLENRRTLSSQSGGGLIRIYNPFKLDEYIQISRAEDFQKYIEKNETLLLDYQKKIDKLSHEKKRLRVR